MRTTKKELYKPNIKKLKEILDSPQIYTILNQQSLDLVKKIVEIIDKQRKRKNLKVNEEDKNQIETVLDLLLQIVIEKQITPILKDLVNEFVILAADWNENVGQKIEIRQKIYSLRTFIDYHLSVTDTIRALKVLLKRVEEIQKFTPPAFELSEHYLKSLQKLGTNFKKRGRKKN
jgi:hypothetical protein